MFIDKVRGGATYSGDRKELWKRFKESRRSGAEEMVPGMAALCLGFAGVGELAVYFDIHWLAVVGRAGMLIFGFTAGMMLPVALMAVYMARFRDFRPGVAAYDQAIAQDVVTTLAHQGVMTIDGLAEHLGITRGHLDSVLTSLQGVGAAPVYHDVKNDRLISLHAAAIDDEGCPACGGQLEAAPQASLTCQHCGGVFMGV